MAELAQNLVKKTITLPKSTLEKVLIDGKGKKWMFVPQTSMRWGLIPVDGVALKESGFIDDSLSQSVHDSLESVHAVWRKELEGMGQKITTDVVPLYNTCIAEGERAFRKDFVAKLARHGAGVLQKILSEASEEIGKLWNQNRRVQEKNNFTLSSNGLLPSNTRCKWQYTTPTAVYELFLLEFPPQKHTINISGKRYHVAFPWMYIVIAFKNGVFITNNIAKIGNHSAFWVFYRNSQLTSEKDMLYFSHLPHIWDAWPHMWCLGYSIPVIKLSDPQWCSKILDYFWNTQFIWTTWLSPTIHNYYVSHIPEVLDQARWEKISRTTPELMLKLSWKPFETLETFVKKLCDWFRSAEGASAQEQQIDLTKAQQELVGRLTKKLDEELRFLGARLIIPVELGDVVKKVMGEYIAYFGVQELRDLEEKCKQGTHNAIDKVLGVWKEEGHTNDIANLDS